MQLVAHRNVAHARTLHARLASHTHFHITLRRPHAGDQHTHTQAQRRLMLLVLVQALPVIAQQHLKALGVCVRASVRHAPRRHPAHTARKINEKTTTTTAICTTATPVWKLCLLSPALISLYYSTWRAIRELSIASGENLGAHRRAAGVMLEEDCNEIRRCRCRRRRTKATRLTTTLSSV